MSTMFGSILTAVLISQLPSATVEGKVVDENANPVAGAQVVFFAPPALERKTTPVEVRTNTDGTGQFRLMRPTLRRDRMIQANFWAYHPGSTLAAAPGYQPAPAIALTNSEPRTIRIEGPGGQPIAGARICPRLVLLASRNVPDEVPDSLAELKAVVTGPNGTAVLDYLTPGDRLVAVRITAEPIGTQDFQLVKRPGREGQGATITLKLEATSRLSGRLRNRAGQPVANQLVEFWSQGNYYLATHQVGFKKGPLRTVADGSFQTPDNLLVGSSYRIVVRPARMEPVLSEWITIGEKPRILLPMILRPLRTLTGRVVDRQGKPVAGIEVFQSGDGPERTRTKTDLDGRFALSGFCQGPVFLFARGYGFRFCGRLVKPGDGDIVVEVTRTTERPAREMKMLPDPIPLEESRALARRLIEPYWEGLEKKNPSDRQGVLQVLARADPVGVLHKLEEVGVANPGTAAVIQLYAARALAGIDPTQAEVAADAIAEPFVKTMALLHLVDVLPDVQLDRKLAILDRALAQAKLARGGASRLGRMAAVALRYDEVGEKEKARALLAEAAADANQAALKYSSGRVSFTVALAPFDLKTAVDIAKQFPASGQWPANAVLAQIAFRIAEENPVEAERVLKLVPAGFEREWFVPRIVWRMAAADPARARALVDESQRSFNNPNAYLVLANGLKTRDPAAAHQAFQTAMEGIDRLTQDESLMLGPREILLPMVEQVDPALVPEYFWRVVAMRPCIGDPKSANTFSSALLTALLAWYNRDVAAALFEPVRAAMESAENSGPTVMGYQAWSVFDPRAAVARLERTPITPKFQLGSDSARVIVAEALGLPHEERWRSLWRADTEMSMDFDRGIR
jgi:hypothetical protein